MINRVMKKRFTLIVMALMVVVLANGQNDRKVIRDGIKDYEDGEYGEAEVQFRKAENINHESFEAEFNTGTALYAQEKYEETVKQYQSLLEQTDDTEKEASIWHNIGNSLLEAQQYEPSIEAYKNSLRKNPSDMDSRYNLAYAKQKLNEQQQQQQNQDDQNQDKSEDQQDQEEKKDQEQKNDQQEQDDQQEQEQNKDQQEQEEDKDQQDQKQQPQPQEISKEDAERMLKAIQQQEKDVKEKVDKKRAAAAKVKTEKDW